MEKEHLLFLVKTYFFTTNKVPAQNLHVCIYVCVCVCVCVYVCIHKPKLCEFSWKKTKDHNFYVRVNLHFKGRKKGKKIFLNNQIEGY